MMDETPMARGVRTIQLAIRSTLSGEVLAKCPSRNLSRPTMVSIVRGKHQNWIRQHASETEAATYSAYWHWRHNRYCVVGTDWKRFARRGSWKPFHRFHILVSSEYSSSPRCSCPELAGSFVEEMVKMLCAGRLGILLLCLF